jgi:hypothetical protein
MRLTRRGRAVASLALGLFIVASMVVLGYVESVGGAM